MERKLSIIGTIPIHGDEYPMGDIVDGGPRQSRESIIIEPEIDVFERRAPSGVVRLLCHTNYLHRLCSPYELGSVGNRKETGADVDEIRGVVERSAAKAGKVYHTLQ